MNDIRLKRQLRAQVSTRQEADELAALAGKLRRMPLPPLDKDAKDRIAERLDIHPRRYRLERRLSLATSFAVVALLVVAVQAATPQSRLYGIKDTVNKFIPWSHQLPMPHEPLAHPAARPAQTSQAPTTHDERTAAPSTSHVTRPSAKQKDRNTDTGLSLPSLQQPDDSDGIQSGKLPENLHALFPQSITDQVTTHEKL